MVFNVCIFVLLISSSITTLMKQSILTLAFFAVCAFAFAQTTPVANPTSPSELAAPDATPHSGANMKFETVEMDYGTLDQGGDPLRIFTFTNVGTEPLIIKNAKGSCGCTVPTWPKEPIMPGETNKIEVRYDTQRVGPFSKRITIETNEDIGTRALTIKGEVRKVTPDEPVPTVKPNVLQGNGSF